MLKYVNSREFTYIHTDLTEHVDKSLNDSDSSKSELRLRPI